MSANLVNRAEVFDYFASLNPLASKIMASSLVTRRVEEEEGGVVRRREDTGSQLKNGSLNTNQSGEGNDDQADNYGSDEDDDETIQIFPKFIPRVAKKIIVDENDGKTWEDEHSGQFTWETSSQLELDLDDLAPQETARRRRTDSVGGAGASPVRARNSSPSIGPKATPVRKARLVENWLDSPVLKAMQENSSHSEKESSEEREVKHPESTSGDAEGTDILSKFGITFSLAPSKTESSTDLEDGSRKSPGRRPVESPPPPPRAKRESTQRSSRRSSKTYSRNSNESTKPSAEPSRPSAEPSRPSAEPSRPSAEPSRPSAEPSRPSAEPSRPSDEPSRPPALLTRRSSEFIPDSPPLISKFPDAIGPSRPSLPPPFDDEALEPDESAPAVDLGHTTFKELEGASPVKSGFDFLDNW